MKSKFFNILLLPPLMALLCGVICIYLFVRFDARVPVQETNLANLQSSIQLVDCQVLDKGVVLAIAQGSLEDRKNFVELFLIVGLLFFAISVVNCVVVLNHLNRSD
mgnify:CR=1 FL=1